MPAIETTRFGKLDIEENRIIHFPDGLLGFQEKKDFVILDHRSDSPFCWLQSVEAPDLAFVLTNPFLIKKDYLERLSPDEEALFQGEGADIVVFVLVTIPQGRVKEMTANLLGPIVIDAGTRTGRQVVLPNAGYSHRYPLIPQ